MRSRDRLWLWWSARRRTAIMIAFHVNNLHDEWITLSHRMRAARVTACPRREQMSLSGADYGDHRHYMWTYQGKNNSRRVRDNFSKISDRILLYSHASRGDAVR